MSTASFILNMAHAGLGTAASYLDNKAKSKEKAGDIEGAKKDRKLAVIIRAADAGIIQYLTESDV